MAVNYKSIAQKLKFEGRAFINGKYVNAIDGKKLETINPATGEKLCSVAKCNEKDVNLAVKVSIESSDLDESDFEEMRQHGFSDDDIWDTGAVSAFFSLSNRMANLTDMRANDEFYLLGRIPKK